MLRNIPATMSFIKLLKWNRHSSQLLFSPFCTQTPNCSKLSGDWTKEATQLLQLIVAEYSTKKNKTFVLPWADQEAINSTIYPFERLLFQGVASQFLFDICLSRESLFRKMTKEGTQTYQILLVFVENFSMTFEDATRFFGKWSDEMTGETAESIQKRMSVFLGRGILSGPQLGKIVKKCPALLFSGDAQKMDSCLERIMNYFQAGQLKKLMKQSPHICLLNEDELEEKYEYIYYHMGIECTELVDSIQWMDLKLEQIIARHEFLCKIGKYFFPDPKKPQFKKGNPTAKQIFDTDEQKFPEEIGEVTNEEWLVFQELWERERRMQELDKPYERVKASQRKAFERRLKKARTAEEGEISDGVLSHQ